ncbi:hypothetical protein ACJX0J_014886, partial [Zea mays]
MDSGRRLRVNYAIRITPKEGAITFPSGASPIWHAFGVTLMASITYNLTHYSYIAFTTTFFMMVIIAHYMLERLIIQSTHPQANDMLGVFMHVESVYPVYIYSTRLYLEGFTSNDKLAHTKHYLAANVFFIYYSKLKHIDK